jgi:hypothetical protein
MAVTLAAIAIFSWFGFLHFDGDSGEMKSRKRMREPA